MLEFGLEAADVHDHIMLVAWGSGLGTALDLRGGCAFVYIYIYTIIYLCNIYIYLYSYIYIYMYICFIGYKTRSFFSNPSSEPCQWHRFEKDVCGHHLEFGAMIFV